MGRLNCFLDVIFEPTGGEGRMLLFFAAAIVAIVLIITIILLLILKMKSKK